MKCCVPWPGVVPVLQSARMLLSQPLLLLLLLLLLLGSTQA
jgi:hypothetical protein